MSIGRLRGRGQVWAATAACVLGYTLAARSAAAEPCAFVVASPGLAPPWHLAAASLQDQLAAGGIDCAGASVALERDGERANVSVIASDGRRARRQAVTPREVVAVVAGVVASIPPESAPEIEPPRPSFRAPVVALTEPSAGPQAEALPLVPPRELNRAANIGATFGTRLGLPSGILATELELRGDVNFGRSLVSLSGRVAPSGTPLFKRGASADWEYAELSVGLLAGRSYPLGGGQFSLVVGPRVGIVTRETETSTVNRKDLWLQAAARWVLPIGERWRPAISLEAEGAPTRFFASISPALSDFPVWSSSLRFGIVGGVP